MVGKRRSKRRDLEWGGEGAFDGDLHLGIYALVNGEVKVLDWEHAHLNYPYWDLCHVIDLSHPLFPKTMTSSVRERLLDVYLEESARLGRTYEPVAFKANYRGFSALFSLWMLRLIASDLSQGEDGPWPREALRQQRDEAAESLRQCVSSEA